MGRSWCWNDSDRVKGYEKWKFELCQVANKHCHLKLEFGLSISTMSYQTVDYVRQLKFCERNSYLLNSFEPYNRLVLNRSYWFWKSLLNMYWFEVNDSLWCTAAWCIIVYKIDEPHLSIMSTCWTSFEIFYYFQTL